MARRALRLRKPRGRGEQAAGRTAWPTGLSGSPRSSTPLMHAHHPARATGIPRELQSWHSSPSPKYRVSFLVCARGECARFRAGLRRANMRMQRVAHEE